jgi:hypothetical protein
LGLIPESVFDSFGRVGFGADYDGRWREQEDAVADALLVTVNRVASTRQEVDYAL